MRVLVILNADSGQGEAREAALAALRAAGLEIADAPATASAREASQLVRTAARWRTPVDAVVVGGGDGTLSGVVGALVLTGLPLGILPLGTANDFARGLGIPEDVGEAARVIAAGCTRRVDVGEIAGHRRRQVRYFLNTAAVGLASAAARNSTGWLKKVLRSLAYPVSVARAALRLKPFAVRLTLDGREMRMRVLQVSVGNSRYFGGGALLSRGASVRDGLAEVVAIPKPGLLEAARIALSARRGGIGRARTVHLGRARDILIETRRPRRIMADGDDAGRTPARIRIRAGALAVIAPAWPVQTQAGAGGAGQERERDTMEPIVREPLEEALAALARALMFVASGYAAGAEHGGENAEAAARLSRERAEDVARFEGHIRALGALPPDREADRQAVRDVLAAARTALMQDALSGRLAEEEAVLDAAVTALDVAEGEVLRRDLMDLRDRVEAQIQRLADG